MAEEPVHFEFDYDHGSTFARYYGCLPRGQLDLLLNDSGPELIAIADASHWEPEAQAFIRLSPSVGEPGPAAFFSRSRIIRLWPVSLPAGGRAIREAEDRPPSPRVLTALEAFFGEKLKTPRIVHETLSESELPNLELAVADLIEREATATELLGVTANDELDFNPGLRKLFVPPSRDNEHSVIRIGPPEWKRVAVDIGQHQDCLARGIRLLALRRGKVAFAVWPDRFQRGSFRLEVIALEQELPRAVLDDLRDGMNRRSIYRGRVIQLKPQREGCGYGIEFAPLKVPAREDIVLPAGLLEIVERNALAMVRHRDRLLAAGRHLRRGLLLHGKPGTGKTLTARYLAGQLQEYTIVLLTGPSLQLLPQACQLARALSPSAVILEDVDLIARERADNRYASLLHDLLDEMDGLSPKIEMVFLLTTNRPDILEPALASRPGRIDQAIEFPLPDADERRRLFALFSRGLSLADDLETFVARTEGASGAFIEELLRRAVVFAAEEGSARVGTPHVDAALRELVLRGGTLTRNLLGYEATP